MCQKFYGDVKIIRLSQNVYRVFSIPFSGELEAGSYKEAANAACKESAHPMKYKNNPAQNRNRGDCD